MNCEFFKIKRRNIGCKKILCKKFGAKKFETKNLIIEN